MNLNELKKGKTAKIISINSDAILKSRLSSFGITRGTIINVIEYTIAKNTIEIQINNTKLALRNSEAQLIEVEELK